MGGADDHEDTGSRLKVVYITASGRSGSTLVGNILGAFKGFFHAGELRTLWGQGLLRGRPCGCGTPVSECAFWHSVLTRVNAIDRGSGLDPAGIERLQRRVVRFRHLLRMLREPSGRLPPQEELRQYVETAGRLYLALSDVTGARVIVDSSKHPADGALLRFLPRVEPYFVQLVRDPRAVTYSWQRHKRTPGERAREEMIRVSSATSSKNWLIVNLAAEATRWRATTERSMLVRYESFIAQPERSIARVLNLIGEEAEDSPFLDANHVRLTAGHTAGGNPDRFHSGVVSLREDTEWLHAQKRRDRMVATAIALPLLPRYRYPVILGRSGRDAVV